jgi:NAD+ synthase (glutamine-hydrolysing)
VIVFPELALSGYSCADLFFQPLLIKTCKEQLERIAEATKGLHALIAVGLPVAKDGALYDAAAVLCDGELLGVVPKMHLTNDAGIEERRYFAKGCEAALPFTYAGKKTLFGANLLFDCTKVDGLTIGCELGGDLHALFSPGASHAANGATMLLHPTANIAMVDATERREHLLSVTSAKYACAYLSVSAGEGESTQDAVFRGEKVLAENGTVVARSVSFAEEILVSEIDVDCIRTERLRRGCFGAPNYDAYTRVPFQVDVEQTPLTRTYAKNPFVPEDAETLAKRCEEILAIQAHGLKKRLEHTGMHRTVIGLSGGLDSTLALLATVRAFDLLGLSRQEILAVTMPCFGTTGRTYRNACTLAQCLGVRLQEIDIRASVNRHFADIGQDPACQDATYENAQARERTQVLMDLANKENGLVIGTGDMSELALGWATYNGDHMSMYGMNAGIPKTLVRHLVKYCAKTTDDAALRTVLTDVVETPVSPELLPPADGEIAQKTEDLVGPYELHDFFLYYMLRYGFSTAKIYRIALQVFEAHYDAQTIKKWLITFVRRYFAQQFKRSCLPDGPKVGSVAISPRGDLRMPSDACARIWLEEANQL